MSNIPAAACLCHLSRAHAKRRFICEVQFLFIEAIVMFQENVVLNAALNS